MPASVECQRLTKFSINKNVVGMNVSLTPELEALVNKKVKSGRYTSASEVVREALRLLEERDRMNELRMKHLVEAGVAELDAGLGAPLDMKEIKAKARKRKKAR